LRHLKAGLIDSKNFLSFYLEKGSGSGSNRDRPIPADLLQSAVELEKMFSRFNLFYGGNEEMRCSDCGPNVRHIF
jgi:hypothetical protein